MKQYDTLRRQIVETAQRAFAAKLFAGTSGNLSVYLREDGVILITPSSIRYETMLPEDIVVIDLDGRILSGKHDPSSEWRMHAAVYREYPHVNAVFHTHSPFATAFAACRRPIPQILVEMGYYLGGAVQCAPFAEPGTAAVGESVTPLLKSAGGCLLANHGVLTVGADLDEAYIRAEYVEGSAQIAAYAQGIGTPTALSPALGEHSA
jgi:L-ribulose-5-phosphate 4-epimerase